MSPVCRLGALTRNRKVDAYLPPIKAHAGSKSKTQSKENSEYSGKEESKPQLKKNIEPRPMSGKPELKPLTKSRIESRHISGKQESKPQLNNILKTRPPSGKPESKPQPRKNVQQSHLNRKPELTPLAKENTEPSPLSGKPEKKPLAKKNTEPSPLSGKPEKKPQAKKNTQPRTLSGKPENKPLAKKNVESRPLSGKPEPKPQLKKLIDTRPASGKTSKPQSKNNVEKRPSSGRPVSKPLQKKEIETDAVYGKSESKPQVRKNIEPRPPSGRPDLKPRPTDSRATTRPPSGKGKPSVPTDPSRLPGLAPRPPSAAKTASRSAVQIKHAPKAPATNVSGAKPRPFPGRLPQGMTQKTNTAPEPPSDATVKLPAFHPHKGDIKFTPKGEVNKCDDVEDKDGGCGVDDDDDVTYDYEDDFEDYNSSDDEVKSPEDDRDDPDIAGKDITDRKITGREIPGKENANIAAEDTGRERGAAAMDIAGRDDRRFADEDIADNDHEMYNADREDVNAYMARVNHNALTLELRRWENTLARLQAEWTNGDRELEDTSAWYVEAPTRLEESMAELEKCVMRAKQSEHEAEKLNRQAKDLERSNDEQEAQNFADELDLLERIKQTNVEEEMVKAFKEGRLEALIREIKDEKTREIMTENLILQRKLNSLKEAYTDIELFGDRRSPEKITGTGLTDQSNDGCLAAFVKIRTLQMDKKEGKDKEPLAMPSILSPNTISGIVDTQDLEEDSCLEQFMKERKVKTEEIMRKKSRPQIDTQKESTAEVSTRPSVQMHVPKKRTLVTDIVKDIKDLPKIGEVSNKTPVERSFEIIKDVSDLPDLIESKAAADNTHHTTLTKNSVQRSKRVIAVPRITRTPMSPARVRKYDDVLSEDVMEIRIRSTRPTYVDDYRADSQQFQKAAGPSNVLFPSIANTPDRPEGRLARWNTTNLRSRTPVSQTTDLPSIGSKKTGWFHSRKRV